MDFIVGVLQIASIVLQVVLVFFLIGTDRKYVLLLIRSVAQLIANVLEPLVAHQWGNQSAVFAKVYWTDEVVLDFLIFLVVISLAYSASEDSPMRQPLQKLLLGILIVVTLLPFVLLQHPLFTTHWFNRTSQILNFGASIMNLALWSVLLAGRRRDTQLLTVSVGVGVAVTGAAIAWGVRQWMHIERQWIPDTFLAVVYLASVLIWCWAFRPAAKAERARARLGAIPGNRPAEG